jgi:hypothetical protein
VFAAKLLSLVAHLSRVSVAAIIGNGSQGSGKISQISQCGVFIQLDTKRGRALVLRASLSFACNKFHSSFFD